MYSPLQYVFISGTKAHVITVGVLCKNYITIFKQTTNNVNRAGLTAPSSISKLNNTRLFVTLKEGSVWNENMV